MKKIKIIFTAAIISFALASLATGDGVTQRKQVVNISLDRAIYNYALGQAIYMQLNDDFLSEEKPVYVCRVFFEDKIYLISGSASQWTDFFDQWGSTFKKKWVYQVNPTATGPEIK